jgi:uncharacterized protein YecE (DUF72 family)
MADSSTATVVRDDAPLLRVGCAGLPAGISRAPYFQRLDLLEIDATLFDPPGDLALRRWRGEAPPGAAFTMLAWQLITHDFGGPSYERLTSPLDASARGQVGSFRDTQEVKQAWERSLRAARALGTEVILFQTPPSFSPSEMNRDRMRRFFGEVVGEVNDVTLAWEPKGVWEPAQAAKLAEELRLVVALDPLQLEVPPPEGPGAYFRLYGLGLYRNKIDDEHLDELAELVSAHQRCWVVFSNVEKYADAQRFRKLLGGRPFVASDDV